MPGYHPDPESPTASNILGVAEAMMRNMEAVANDGPVLLAFDDLHFLDPASREVLFLITRRLERVPTLILAGARAGDAELRPEDRKSTRLNSSHVRISYAVFCLKNKAQAHVVITSPG